MTFDIISAPQAKLKGYKFFYTGKRCKNGHLSLRRTSNRCCVDCEVIKSRIWKEKNPEKSRKINLKQKEKNRERDRERSKKYYWDNHESCKQKRKQYAKANKDKTNEYRRKKYRSDPIFKLGIVIRTNLISSLKAKNLNRNGSAVRLLGCSIGELKLHLESQFQPGMTWENHGKWHIDHIAPLALFDLTNPEHLAAACNYKNLQPLWARDNLRKSDKFNIMKYL